MVETVQLLEPTVLNFEIKDLSTCDCAVAIVKAVIAVDGEASVYVRMATQSVEVTTAAAGAPELLHAISDAGFAAVFVPEQQSAAAAWSVAFPNHRPRNLTFEPDGTEFDSGDA